MTATVTVARGTGLTDPIVLSATGLPAGVTASFAPMSLPPGTDSSIVTLTIDQAANAGMADIMLTGTAGSLTHSATVSLDLQTQTVAGKVRGTGAGIAVRIVGKAATQTDATGNFMFTDVKVPYDIYVLGQGGPDSAPIPAITYYKGLTRLDPVLTKQNPYCTNFCLVAIFNNKSANLNGSRFGAGTNAGPTYVKFTTTDGREINTTGTWGFTAAWFAQITQNTIVGRLQGLQAIRGALNAPIGWYFAESADVTLTNTGTSTINLTLATLGTTGALSGTVTQPAGFTVPTVTLTQQLAGSPFEVWTATTNNATSTIPILTNQKASFYATATSGGAVTEGVVPGITASTDVTMALPAPASVTGPVNGASNVTTATPFEFSTTANQVYEVSMNSSAAIYVIYTASGSLTIPNVSEMPLPSAAAFTWAIRGFGPLASVNASADMNALQGVAKFDPTGTYHSLTTSTTRNFTSM
ncbi:MAG TPA: hypothetical protein VLB44_14605 [Kofleriaceae bacterium]|nr:hypothetical protein [Kofleriaceae bacterium]